MSYINKHVQELLQFNYRVDIHPLNIHIYIYIHILSSERKTSVSSHSMIWTNGTLNTHVAACRPLKGVCCAAVVMERVRGRWLWVMD